MSAIDDRPTTVEGLARAVYAASGSLLAWDETGSPEHRLYRALAAAAVLFLADDDSLILDQFPEHVRHAHAEDVADAVERRRALIAEARQRALPKPADRILD